MVICTKPERIITIFNKKNLISPFSWLLSNTIGEIDLQEVSNAVVTTGNGLL